VHPVDSKKTLGDVHIRVLRVRHYWGCDVCRVLIQSFDVPLRLRNSCWRYRWSCGFDMWSGIPGAHVGNLCGRGPSHFTRIYFFVEAPGNVFFPRGSFVLAPNWLGFHGLMEWYRVQKRFSQFLDIFYHSGFLVTFLAVPYVFMGKFYSMFSYSQTKKDIQDLRKPFLCVVLLRRSVEFRPVWCKDGGFLGEGRVFGGFCQRWVLMK